MNSSLKCHVARISLYVFILAVGYLYLSGWVIFLNNAPTWDEVKEKPLDAILFEPFYDKHYTHLITGKTEGYISGDDRWFIYKFWFCLNAVILFILIIKYFRYLGDLEYDTARDKRQVKKR